MPAFIASIAVYPVKSLAPMYLERAELVRTGLRFDREWMVVDEHGHFVTQRQHPEMALIGARASDEVLTLRVPGRQPLTVANAVRSAGAGPPSGAAAEVGATAASDTAANADTDPEGVASASGATAAADTSHPRQTVRVWDSRCEALDGGGEAAAILSEYLGRRCRLVRMRPGFHRPLGASYPNTPGISLSLADSSPLMITSEASLAELNSRLERPVSMDRFRPSIVIAGVEPYEEDRWQCVRIGGVIIRVVKDCIRCQIINVDQRTGERGIEPLETLGAYRSGPRGARFGRRAVHEQCGAIAVGDPVEVEEQGDG